MHEYPKSRYAVNTHTHTQQLTEAEGRQSIEDEGKLAKRQIYRMQKEIITFICHCIMGTE